MLCSALLCCMLFASLCYAMLRSAVLCHGLLCYAMLCCAVLCDAMRCCLFYFLTFTTLREVSDYIRYTRYMTLHDTTRSYSHYYLRDCSIPFRLVWLACQTADSRPQTPDRLCLSTNPTDPTKRHGQERNDVIFLLCCVVLCCIALRWPVDRSIDRRIAAKDRTASHSNASALFACQTLCRSICLCVCVSVTAPHRTAPHRTAPHKISLARY